MVSSNKSLKFDPLSRYISAHEVGAYEGPAVGEPVGVCDGCIVGDIVGT